MTIPIRLRLTLWNSLIFGSIITILISLIYYSHKQAHYKDVDIMLNTVTSHVHEEIVKQLDKGKQLKNVQVSIEELGLNQIATMIRSSNGELLETNAHPFIKDHRLLRKGKNTSVSDFQTITDQKEIRIRVLTTPFYRNGEIAGYIQTLYSLKDLDRSLLRFKWMVVFLTSFGIFLASIAAWLLAKKTLSRVELVRRTANAIAVSQDFQQRVLHIGPSDELGKLSETFNDMLESLEKAYKTQKRFLSDASHELRAPLTTIRGNLDILNNIKNIPEKEKDEILRDLRNEAIRMSKLVSDLLSLARADAGQMGDKQMINLSSITKGVISQMLFLENNIKIEFQIEDNVRFWGDEDALKQLLIILVENAIKYTSKGGSVSIFVSIERGFAILRIEDNGIGIDEEELPFVFERFYRTEAAKRHSHDGTGLGLAIAKSIVEDHQGRIVLTSKLGEGTEVVVYFSYINK